MSLSDTDRKAYEQYILAINEEEREEAIKKLIPGSHLYYHLYFINRFKQVGSKLTDHDKKLLEQFKKKYKDHPDYLEISTKLRLLEYDEADQEDKKQQILGLLAQ